jgi:hypothetical protein
VAEIDGKDIRYHPPESTPIREKRRAISEEERSFLSARAVFTIRGHWYNAPTVANRAGAIVRGEALVVFARMSGRGAR